MIGSNRMVSQMIQAYLRSAQLKTFWSHYSPSESTHNHWYSSVKTNSPTRDSLLFRALCFIQQDTKVNFLFGQALKICLERPFFEKQNVL